MKGFLGGLLQGHWCDENLKYSVFLHQYFLFFNSGYSMVASYVDFQLSRYK